MRAALRAGASCGKLCNFVASALCGLRCAAHDSSEDDLIDRMLDLVTDAALKLDQPLHRSSHIAVIARTLAMEIQKMYESAGGALDSSVYFGLCDVLLSFADSPLEWQSVTRVSHRSRVWFLIMSERWLWSVLDMPRVIFALIYRTSAASAPAHESYKRFVENGFNNPRASLAHLTIHLANLRGRRACDHSCLLDAAAAYASLALVAAARGNVGDMARLLDEAQEMFQTVGLMRMENAFEEAEWRPMLTALWGILATIPTTPFVRGLRKRPVLELIEQHPKVTVRESGSDTCINRHTLAPSPPSAVLGLYRVIETVGRLLSWHGVTWFASHGTLLGALRHGGIVPHDCDADFTITEEGSKLLRTGPFLDSLFRNGYELAYRPVQDLYAVFRLGAPVKPSGWRPQLHESKQPYLNLYVVHVNAWDDVEDHFEYMTNRAIHRDLYLARSALFPTVIMPFGTSAVNVPADPEYYLVAMYGHDWRTTVRSLSARTVEYHYAPVDVATYGFRMAVPAGPLIEVRLPPTSS